MNLHFIRILGIKTILILSLNKIFTYILRKLKYYSYHLPIKEEIIELIKKGYLITREKKELKIQSHNSPYKFLIRPLTSDKNVVKQVWEDEEYSKIIELIKDYGLSTEIKTIIDAGSNIGLTTLYFRNFFQSAKIVSIEPDLNNYNLQINNFKINDLHDTNIKVLLNALWINNSDKLRVSNDFRDGNFWSKSIEISENTTSLIEPITLNEIACKYFPQEMIDILKIDIEGSESNLFKDYSFLSTLSNKVKFLCLEVHEEIITKNEISEILQKLNFKLFEKGETIFCINLKLITI
ncbi:methyltransferase, FkbM family [Pedobacter glucosidilyticus]|nr:FkbM family methyltransferase [Pedobacter glucosidilyticus]KHJ36986.1 methyltransferase, FkbM family [Pedobacter glucosidilyticus]